MTDRLGAATLWWGVFAFFAFLTGLALWGVTEMDGFAAGVLATLAFLFFVASMVGAYLAIASHRGWRPFREGPPPLLANVELAPPPPIEPSAEGLTRRLNDLRYGRSMVTPSEREPDED